MRNSAIRSFGISLLLLTGSCDKSTSPTVLDAYFPPADAIGDWETVSPASLGWKTSALPALDEYLQSTSTYGFIILHKGRIAHERYWNGWTKDTAYFWASAGKTLTAYLVGVAEHEGKLDLDDPSREYLGAGWTSMTTAQESAITLRHQLTMTAGFNEFHDGLNGFDCETPSCLTYLAAPGTRWAYHNASYLRLIDALEAATGRTRNQYTATHVRDPLGMSSKAAWFLNDGNVFVSTTRDAARWGWFIANMGRWNGRPAAVSESYFQAMTRPSQTLNPAYGYLWWLNGQANYLQPILRQVNQGPLIPSAPADLIAGLGKDDKKIYVVPSRDLVVIRLGDEGISSAWAVSGYDEEIWKRIMAVID